MQLKITMPKEEVYFEDINEFRNFEEMTFVFVHSLVSISKWEAKHHKAFFGKQEKTVEEMVDYISCMVVSPEEYDPLQLKRLINCRQNFTKLTEYINDPMTATMFRSDNEDKRHGGTSDVPTSELMYYWMIANSIPVEFENWHINRLMTLIKVCSLKNSPQKKRSSRDIMSSNKALNEARKAKLGTRG